MDIPDHDQHFDADKTQYECQAIMQEYKAVGNVGQQEIHGTQAENGKNVGSQHDKGVGGNGKDGGNAIDRKYYVGQFHHD